MKKYTLLFAPIILLFIMGCSQEDISSLKTDSSSNRTLNISATVQTPIQPRASLVESIEGASKVLSFEWEIEDKIQVAFVQNDLNIVKEATVTSVESDKRIAHFNIDIPDQITDDFILYIYYGAGSLDENNPTTISLPDPKLFASDLENQVNLISMWDKKEVTFDGTTTPNVFVSFKHLGSIMSLHVENNSTTDISNFNFIHLSGTSDWLYNESGRAIFNMTTETFDSEGAGNELSINTAETIPSGESQVFYRWFIPGGVFDSDNKLSLTGNDEENIVVGSSGEAAITPKSAFKPGWNYGLHITVDTDKSPSMRFVNTQPNITFVTTKTVGSTIWLRMRAQETHKGDVWIDLNNNGVKDDGEQIPVENLDNSSKGYVLGSNTITIYGKIDILQCNSSNITYLDLSNPNLLTLNAQQNSGLAPIDFSRSLALNNINLKECNLDALSLNSIFNSLIPMSGKLEINGNPGAANAELSIAENKNWVILRSPVTGVSINESELTLIEGLSVSLTATVFPDDADNKEITWTSSDNTVVSVDENGEITAIRAGNATIVATAMDGNFEASCSVTVEQPKIVLSTVKKRPYLVINADDGDKEDIWIDLNNNGIKDEGEQIPLENFHVSTSKGYSFESETVTIYGRVTNFRCHSSEVNFLDISKNPFLYVLHASDNPDLNILDFSKNPDLTTIEIKSCKYIESELNSMFETLLPRTRWGEIRYANNPGSDVADATIVTQKGWSAIP